MDNNKIKSNLDLSFFLYRIFAMFHEAKVFLTRVTFPSRRYLEFRSKLK